MKLLTKLIDALSILTAPSDIYFPILADILLNTSYNVVLIGLISISNLVPTSVTNVIILENNDTNCSLNIGINEYIINPKKATVSKTIKATASPLGHFLFCNHLKNG